MTTALVPHKINDICPSCHPTKHTKTTATFIEKEDEAVDEYLYQCDKCSAKLWVTQKWAIQNKVKGKDSMTKNKFYTEIKLGITVDTDLSLDEINTQLDEGLRAHVRLTQRDDTVVDANVIEVWEVEQWQDWEEM